VRGGGDEAADDEAIAGERAEWRGGVDAELRERGGARCERGLVDEGEGGEDLGRAVVDEDLGAGGEWCGRGGEVTEFDVEDVGRGDAVRMREQVATREVFDGDTAEVEGRAEAGDRAVDAGAVHLDTTDAGGEAGRDDGELVADRDLAAEDGAGDDRTEAFDREDAIDREAEDVGVRSW
jgi:hypothetical protein